MKNLLALNKYFYRYKYHFFLGILFVISHNLFKVFIPEYVKDSINSVEQILKSSEVANVGMVSENVKESILNVLKIKGMWMLVFALTSGFFLFLTRQTIIVMSRLIENDLKNDLYAHLQELDTAFYKANNTGDIVARLSEDVGKVRMYLGPAVMYGINMLASTIATIYFMFRSNVELSIYALLPMPILSFAIFYINARIERYSTELQENLSDLSTAAQEAFSGIRVIKSFSKEDNIQEMFTQNSLDYKQKSMKLTRIQGLFQPIMTGLVGVSIALVVYIGAKKVMNNELEVGHIAQFVLYIVNLTWPFTAIGWVTSIVQRAEVSQKRLNEIMDQKNSVQSDKNLTTALQGNIKFKDVSFTYPLTGIKALQNVSFEINSGQTLGILGSTGSGKSTIAALLTRQYDATEGAIFIDQTKIQDFAPKHIKENIGYVPQDVFLFSETIHNNIAFGLENASDEDVMRVAKLADVHDNIMDFPQKYETILGERGITLSGGQKQRVSIARALIKNPTIVLLDDCLSAVDTHTENTILNNLQKELQNKTAVVISHRVSSVKFADHIIVLDKGKILEQGNHDQLLSLNGTYAQLFEKQLKSNLI
ncbi:MAG: ABC transporter ATP-binding protein [Cytophagales bacterium]